MTVIGLVFAVLSERIRWATAFKTIIFMPIVFSVTASSLVFTQIFELDPHIGVVNAIIQTVDDWFHPPGAYPLLGGPDGRVARHERWCAPARTGTLVEHSDGQRRRDGARWA